MPQQNCTGTTSINGFALVSNSCIYQLTMKMDGVVITNTVAVNSGMTPTQIANLLNANRTGNTTGTFSVQLSGNNLIITITGIILPDGAAGIFLYTITGTGFPCGDFTIPLPVPMSCTIVPPSRPKGKFIGPSFQFCVDPRHYPNGCPQTITLFRVIYYYIGTNEYGLCCYSNNKNLRPGSILIYPK